jgi:flagellar hook protein FlgE
MSILRSLNTGAAGLRAHSDAIDVVGDNIANVNTVGFKRSRAIFQDILGRSIAGASAVPSSGGGSRVSKVQQMWSQGALLTTDSPTDLALSGDGFFIMKGTANGAQGNFYSRAGQFTLNSDGYLTNPSGLVLQGYGVNNQGVIQANLGDLLINPGTVAATPSTQVDIAANLDAVAVAPIWDPADPGGTSNFSTQVTVYDSLGAAHGVTVYFVKGAPPAAAGDPQDWSWNAMVDSAEIDPAAPGYVAGEPYLGATGTLTFNTDGALIAETPAAFTWDFLGATPGQAIAFDFGTSVADGGTGLDGTTQFAAASTTTGISQDGYGAGSVAAISVSNDGVVTGVFTNGQRRTLGQVAVADFGSVDGLARAGDGLWAETRESSQPLIGPPETGGRAAIVSGALEQSNVDLGQEFVSLIAFQRGFSANSKIITTADEMYQELVNLKR